MKRFVAEKLEAWKNSPRRKPLVLRGARQVGKTWSVLDFGRSHFEGYPSCATGYVFSCAPYSELPDQRLVFLPLYYAGSINHF